MTLVPVLLLAAVVAQAPAAPRPLPFSDPGWELQDAAAVATVDGKPALAVESGFAHRRDLRLENGTIDFDVQLTRRRSFVYVHFRAVSAAEREEFYLRPHKSGLPDALQYAPVWQGRSAWQLHHGPGGTAAVAFEPGAWTHVRVVVHGRAAALFVGDMTRPALLVPALSRDPQPGGIALGAFLPAGVPGSGPIAQFANVVVQTDGAADLLAAAVRAAGPEGAAPAPADAGIVRAWAVSRALVLSETATPALPDPETVGEFRRVEAEAGGLLQLHRHVRLPEKAPAAAAVARLRARVERTGLYAFDLGFSDVATVFVNGRPIFRGEGSYSFDRPRREGLIGFDQARLFLPLMAGDNEVAVVVSDSFGGWGLMGRFVTPGVTVEAR